MADDENYSTTHQHEEECNATKVSPISQRNTSSPSDVKDSRTPANISSSGEKKLINKDEAELAAMIAKVTGRAGPFVNSPRDLETNSSCEISTQLDITRNEPNTDALDGGDCGKKSVTLSTAELDIFSTSNSSNSLIDKTSKFVNEEPQSVKEYEQDTISTCSTAITCMMLKKDCGEDDPACSDPERDSAISLSSFNSATDVTLNMFEPLKRKDTEVHECESSETKNNSKAEKVKACYPSSVSKITLKSFEMSPDSQQHQDDVINRRMAARNATAFAELDPLVTVSPEAHKLAMWSSMKSAGKKDLNSESEKKFNPPLLSLLSSLKVKKHSPESTKLKEKDPCNREPSEKPASDDKEAASDVPPKKGKIELWNDKDSKRREIAARKEFIVCSLFLAMALGLLFVLSVGFMSIFSFLASLCAPNDVIGLDGKTRGDQPKAQTQVGDTLNENDEPNEGIYFEDSAESIENQEEYYDENIYAHVTEEEQDFHDEVVTRKPLFITRLTENNDQKTKSQIYNVICRSFNDYEGAELCQKVKPTILKLTLKFIRRCSVSGKIILNDYIRMYRYLNSFFSSIGGFAEYQAKLLADRLLEFENIILSSQHRKDDPDLVHLLFDEAITGVTNRTKPYSGTILFTCLHRHLQFLTLALEYVVPLELDENLQKAFAAAYNEVLVMHHPWLLELVYEMGMYTLPTKGAAALLLSIRQVEEFSLDIFLESLKILIPELKRVNDIAEHVLINSHALQEIPEQVIM